MNEQEYRERWIHTRDETGNVVLVRIWTEMIEVDDLGSGYRLPRRCLPGLTRIETADGTPCSWLAKGRYRAFSVPERILTSDDPEAP